MIRPPPRSTRTDPLFPSTTLFRSLDEGQQGRLRFQLSAPVRHQHGWPRGECAGGKCLLHHVRGRQWIGAGRRVVALHAPAANARSEEHTSELQSLMRISYAVFCLKKKKKTQKQVYKKNKLHK